MELKKMNDYSDRELLELIMASQAQIMSRLKTIANHMKQEYPDDPWDPEKEVIGEGMWETINGANDLNNEIETMLNDQEGSGS